jgi:hypothetical protein
MYIPFFSPFFSVEKKNLGRLHIAPRLLSSWHQNQDSLSSNPQYKPTIQTRTKNKTSHPGQVVNDAKQKCRSQDEMAKIRADETRSRQEKEEELAENIQKAAEVEDRMRWEDINRRSSNRHATGQAPFKPLPVTVNTWGAEDKGDPEDKGQSDLKFSGNKR